MVSNFRPHREPLHNLLMVLLLFLAGLVSACSTSNTSGPSPTSTSTQGIRGIFHEYTLPPSQFVPGSITAGPDGNLWFAEFQYSGTGTTAGEIRRITTAGKISDFPLPTSSNSPTSITFGTDHTLWFIEVEVTPTNPNGKNGKIGHLV